MPAGKGKRVANAADIQEAVKRMKKVSASEMPWDQIEASLDYVPGFGAELQSEALPGALPEILNNPQKCPYGLYSEQLSGTSFTTPRSHNRRSWLYRILPSVTHRPFRPIEVNDLWLSDFSNQVITPNQIRWNVFPEADDTSRVDFIEGIRTICGAGNVETKAGLACHIYAANASMDNKAFCNSDGDMLIVPELGELFIQTEFGLMFVKPGEIAVMQRGVRFSVRVNGSVRGYIAEVYDGHFTLPELGPIGANGLANARDFLHPTAHFEHDPEANGTFSVVHKFIGKFFAADQPHSPFNVVAWHGNYSPFKYDLDRFCAMNSVTFDHPDPSIFTVLTVATASPGVAALDFVIFPPRWQVQNGTFRPPYYHRNVMAEFMGNIRGQYEAKEKGFPPGSASLHSCASPHGPDTESFEKHTNAELNPIYLDNMLAFMFESTYMFRVSDYAAQPSLQDRDYYKCWAGLKDHFQV